MNSKAPSVFDLTPAEKLQLVEDLWDDLAATPEAIPTQPWHVEELDRRKRALEANPDNALEWEEVKKRVRRLYGR
jgi:putative addiction module component (TIGR02574 family)